MLLSVVLWKGRHSLSFVCVLFFQQISFQFSVIKKKQPTETQDDAEARNDFWSIEADFIYRHHTEPRVHFHVPKEESFPFH